MAINASLQEAALQSAADFVPLAPGRFQPLRARGYAVAAGAIGVDLIALAKDKPGRLAFASAGPARPIISFPSCSRA